MNRLGLTTLSPFDYRTRIIEYAVDSSNSSPLLNRTVRDFVNDVAARKPAPGGGAVAALTGSMVCFFISLILYLKISRNYFLCFSVWKQHEENFHIIFQIVMRKNNCYHIIHIMFRVRVFVAWSVS